MEDPRVPETSIDRLTMKDEASSIEVHGHVGTILDTKLVLARVLQNVQQIVQHMYARNASVQA